jgi:CheY-like chemotaxis protein
MHLPPEIFSKTSTMQGPEKSLRFSLNAPGLLTFLRRVEVSQTGNISRNILIADDDPVIADTLAAILNQKGYKATCVYSGQEAVSAAQSVEPDVLISDVVMGEISGVDAAILIQQRFPHCKVILLSGYAAPFDLPGSAHVDGLIFDFLSKPVHPEVILQRVKQLEFNLPEEHINRGE